MVTVWYGQILYYDMSFKVGRNCSILIIQNEVKTKKPIT